jgi:putative phosphoesterase
MKIGILSDIHGNSPALAAVLAEMRRHEVKDLIFLGDLVGYYPFANECLTMLAGFEVASIRGNHDQIALDCLAGGHAASADYRKAYGSALDRALAARTPELERFLCSLPLRRELTLDGRRFLLCHGAPWNELEGRVYPDSKDWDRFAALSFDAVLLGHTHYPLQRQCGSVLVLNPGSVGQARQRSGVACAALLDVPSMVASLIESPYDPAALIADAGAHDPDLPYLTHVLQR